MTIEILLIGFMIGMRHALEADHLAAIASITSSEKGITTPSAVYHGVFWGVGHTVTLVMIGTTFLLMDSLVPEQVAKWLETFIGFLLIGLGIQVLVRLYRDKVHFHFHKHDGKAPHIHAHSHKYDEEAHSENKHHHTHNVPTKSFIVGLMHGMAGSSVLIMLTLDAAKEFWLGFSYMLLFGVGSIIGMGILSLIISVPLRASKRLNWLHNGLQGSIGAATILLGSMTVYANSFG